MEAYEKWFLREGAQGRRQLAVLRLLGLFDRPASKGCLEALRRKPVITRLTESLVGLAPRDWTIVTRRLEENRSARPSRPMAHRRPSLLREYFGERLRTTQPKAWRAAHRRLYNTSARPRKKAMSPPSKISNALPSLAHGCQAGLQREACVEVYEARILRGEKHYTWHNSERGLQSWALRLLLRDPVEPRLIRVHGSDQAWC